MLITFDAGETGLSPAFQVIDKNKAVVMSRRTTGVTELAAGSGVYGVDVPEPTLYGSTVLWDTGQANAADRAYGAESFDSLGAWFANKMIVTDSNIKVRNADDTADLFVQPMNEAAGVRTRGAIT